MPNCFVLPLPGPPGQDVVADVIIAGISYIVSGKIMITITINNTINVNTLRKFVWLLLSDFEKAMKKGTLRMAKIFCYWVNEEASCGGSNHSKTNLGFFY